MKLTRAAVFEPNATTRRRIAEGLKRAGLSISNATEPNGLKQEQLVVLGPGLKKPARVVQAVKGEGHPRLVLSAQAKGFKAAFADAVLPLPVSPNDLKVRLPELARALDRSTAQRGEAVLDPLTHFYTFSHFKEVLFVEVKRSKRYGFPLSLALVAFDALPERVSPALRDRLFGGLALAIRRSLRDTDYPVQHDPERVLLLMPHTELHGAVVVSQRICERVSRAAVADGDRVLNPTISIGLSAGVPGREYGFAELVRQAQESLRAAQDKGGNRVEFFDAAAEQGRAR